MNIFCPIRFDVQIGSVALYRYTIQLDTSSSYCCAIYMVPITLHRTFIVLFMHCVITFVYKFDSSKCIRAKIFEEEMHQ